MNYVFRLTLASLFLLFSIVCFCFFEYWKLLQGDSQYLLAAAACAGSFWIGTFLAFPIKSQGIKPCLAVAASVTLIVMGSEYLFLRIRSQNDLNRVLAARGRCDSVIVELFPDGLNGTLAAAKTACILRILQIRLAELPSPEKGERTLTDIAGILDHEDQLTETVLVLLLSYQSNFETKQLEKLDLKPKTPIDHLRANLSLVEAEIALLSIYRVKPFRVRESDPAYDALRTKKILELSVLGRTLGVVAAREQSVSEMHEDLKQSASIPGEVSELILLQTRVYRSKESLQRVIKRWNLMSVLNDLDIEDIYPDEYNKVLKDISVG
jgi:hypothetical protein